MLGHLYRGYNVGTILDSVVVNWASDLSVCMRFFYSGQVFFTFLTFFYNFLHVFIFKNVVKCTVWMCKNPTKKSFRWCLSNDFYWFWFVTQPILHNILLTLLTLRYMLKFDNLHMTQCAKIIVGFVANVGNVFMKRLQMFFFKYFFMLFLHFNVFFIFIWTIITSMVRGEWVGSRCLRKNSESRLVQLAYWSIQHP